VLTDSSIPQSNDIWAVCCPNPNQVLDDEPADDIGQRDNFLVISCETQTIVLKCDNDLLALQSSGFYTTGPTIYCGAICDNTLIVQVYRDGVYLLDHSALLFSFPLLFLAFFFLTCSLQRPRWCNCMPSSRENQWCRAPKLDRTLCCSTLTA